MFKYYKYQQCQQQLLHGFAVSSQRLLDDGVYRARKTSNNNPQYIEHSVHAKYHH